MVCSLPFPLLLSDSFLLCPGQYDAHLARQAADIKAFAEDESLLLDPKLEYSTVAGLSGEVIERLYRIRPTTIVCFLLSQAHIWQLTTLFPGCREEDGGDDSYFSYFAAQACKTYMGYNVSEPGACIID